MVLPGEDGQIHGRFIFQKIADQEDTISRFIKKSEHGFRRGTVIFRSPKSIFKNHERVRAQQDIFASLQHEVLGALHIDLDKIDLQVLRDHIVEAVGVYFDFFNRCTVFWIIPFFQAAVGREIRYVFEGCRAPGIASRKIFYLNIGMIGELVFDGLVKIRNGFDDKMPAVWRKLQDLHHDFSLEPPNVDAVGPLPEHFFHELFGKNIVMDIFGRRDLKGDENFPDHLLYHRYCWYYTLKSITQKRPQKH